MGARQSCRGVIAANARPLRRCAGTSYAFARPADPADFDFSLETPSDFNFQDQGSVSRLLDFMHSEATAEQMPSDVEVFRTDLQEQSHYRPPTSVDLFDAKESKFLSNFLESLESGPQSAAPLPSQPQVSTSGPSVPISPVSSPPPPKGTAVKRTSHVASEQQRRNNVRENFNALAELLEEGRKHGARALGLNAGAGMSVEDEDLDDRTDTEEDLSLCLDEETIQRRKRNAQRRARNRTNSGRNARVRGPGRGRGGSAGRSGSKSAVLFQAADLIYWLVSRNRELAEEARTLEAAAAPNAPRIL